MASTLLPGADPLATNDGVLPTDVLREILLRIPAKELCRLRLVCRSWRSLASDPRFARAHSTRHPLFVGLHQGVGADEIHVVDLYSGSIIKRICGLGISCSHLSMQAGLACAASIDTGRRGIDYKDLVLNLATGAVSVLPNGIKINLVLTCVLGQVPSTGEYKVVRVRLCRCTVEETIKTAFEVIALGEQRWRAKPSPVGIIGDFRVTAAVRGVAYFWAGNKYSDDGGSGITLFDLATEEWRSTVIPGPFHYEVNHVKFDSLDGCLVITHLKDRDCSTDLWFLMDEENMPYWSKRYSIRCAPHLRHTPMYPPLYPPCPLIILEDGRIIMWLEWLDVLVVYDPRTQTLDDFAKLEYYFVIGMHQGSLLASGLEDWSLAPSDGDL